MFKEDFDNIDDRDIVVDPSLGFIDEAVEISQECWDKIKVTMEGKACQK